MKLFSGLNKITLVFAVALLMLAALEIPATQAATIYDSFNSGAVSNGPSAPTALSVSSAMNITKVMTYHWNNGSGSTPGTISLRHTDGTVYGPWTATGTYNNRYWTVYPNTIIKSGSYTVIDSNTTTWSYNSASGNAGFVQLEGDVVQSTAQCAYFNETFTGTASNTWSYMDATWAIKSGKVNVSQITSGAMANYDTYFYPYDYFKIDVDIEAVSIPQGGAYGIYPYTSGSAYFTVDGKTLRGIGAYLYASGNAYLFGWDVTANAWYRSSNKYITTPPVTSLGVAYSSDAVTLRINKQNTTLKFSGNFTDSWLLIDSLKLLAQGAGTNVNFDNVCSDPLTTTGALSAPGNLRFTKNGNTVTISWDAVVGAEGYEAAVSNQSGGYSNFANIGNITSTGSLDVSNVPSGTYYIVLKAYKGTQKSGLSNEIAITLSGGGGTGTSTTSIFVTKDSTPLSHSNEIKIASGLNDIHAAITQTIIAINQTLFTDSKKTSFAEFTKRRDIAKQAVAALIDASASLKSTVAKTSTAFLVPEFMGMEKSYPLEDFEDVYMPQPERAKVNAGDTVTLGISTKYDDIKRKIDKVADITNNEGKKLLKQLTQELNTITAANYANEATVNDILGHAALGVKSTCKIAVGFVGLGIMATAAAPATLAGTALAGLNAIGQIVDFGNNFISVADDMIVTYGGKDDKAITPQIPIWKYTNMGLNIIGIVSPSSWAEKAGGILTTFDGQIADAATDGLEITVTNTHDGAATVGGKICRQNMPGRSATAACTSKMPPTTLQLPAGNYRNPETGETFTSSGLDSVIENLLNYISVTFAATYTVTASAGTGGTISPSSITVKYGETTSFYVAPSTGYSISSVTGCGGTLSGNTYTTGKINAACTVSASFKATAPTGDVILGSCAINSVAMSGAMCYQFTGPASTSYNATSQDCASNGGVFSSSGCKAGDIRRCAKETNGQIYAQEFVYNDAILKGVCSTWCVPVAPTWTCSFK